jgi:hypothetical protein
MTMPPPSGWRTMNAPASWATRNVPTQLISNVARRSSAVTSSRGTGSQTAAQVTTASIRPKWSATRWTIARVGPSSRRLAVTASAGSPDDSRSAAIRRASSKDLLAWIARE